MVIMFRAGLKYIMSCAFLAVIAGCSTNQDVVYNSYEGLVMAGYQGWFNAEGDGFDRGFYHYKGRDGFKPGSATVDLWPDVSEYAKTYPTPFKMPDGSVANVFSSADYSTVDLHFKWMKQYGLDGVFMQRFVSEIKRDGSRRHFNTVFDHAMRSARKYNRAIAVMYDLSGMNKNDADFIISDMASLEKKYHLFDRKSVPNYLYHNGKPLVAVWGVGFNDGRKYDVVDASVIVKGLIAKGFSVMVGVPTNWRTLDGDTEDDARLHNLIRECDIVMPWFVGRYDESKYDSYKPLIKADMEWCEHNHVDYAPLIYPGFAWRNMNGENSFFVPRNEGRFFQKQIDGAIELGAKMLYVAMFDEIDEGTAIFKCSKTVPMPEKGTEFVPIDSAISSDHYLKAAGKASYILKKRVAMHNR